MATRIQCLSMASVENYIAYCLMMVIIFMMMIIMEMMRDILVDASCGVVGTEHRCVVGYELDLPTTNTLNYQIC